MTKDILQLDFTKSLILAYLFICKEMNKLDNRFDIGKAMCKAILHYFLGDFVESYEKGYDLIFNGKDKISAKVYQGPIFGTNRKIILSNKNGDNSKNQHISSALDNFHYLILFELQQGLLRYGIIKNTKILEGEIHSNNTGTTITPKNWDFISPIISLKEKEDSSDSYKEAENERWIKYSNYIVDNNPVVKTMINNEIIDVRLK